tara:strand:+ start:165 stop:323 length:159 start_codon:yes stop_codon:yes gene_type:complete
MTNEKVHWLTLRTGYVENNAISAFMLYNERGFDSLQEALESIAKSWISAYEC